MKIKSLTITVKSEDRGNRHGYIGSDYARDAAAEIERSLAAMGRSSWPADDADADLAEASAIREAEEQIAQCDDMFRDLLGIEITDEEIENLNQEK